MGPAAPKQFQRAVAYGAGAVHSEDFRQRQDSSAPFLAILVLCPETGKIKGNLKKSLDIPMENWYDT